MKEILRSNDAVLLSFASALLEDAGIGYVIVDTNMSVMEGSIGVLPRRVLVETDSWWRAFELLQAAGIKDAAGEGS
jgi:hypothetical protein